MPLPKTTELELRRLYWGEGLSLKDIGNHCGRTATTILDWFKYFNIPTRTLSDAQRNAKERGKFGRKDRFVDGRGYVWLLMPSDGRGHKGYRQEHIVVWENLHGCVVPSGFIIHHLDGNPSNNEAKNLIALSRREHMLIEKKIKYLLTLIKSEEGKQCLRFLVRQIQASS